MGESEYRVKSGDTLSSIARRHFVSVEQIARLNGLGDVNVIRAGQVLKIPRPDAVTRVSRPSQVIHRVLAGETLGGIALRYHVTVDALREANRIEDIHRIAIGHRLRIPVAPKEASKDAWAQQSQKGGEPRSSTGSASVQNQGAWTITRDDGTVLFTLKPGPNETQTRRMTVKTLYAEGIQWFEPLADKYRELLSVEAACQLAGTKAHAAFKHFTWKQIIDFAVVDRWAISFASGNAGDWKASAQGGAGYLIVSIEGMPYWADAIGQIPFAVDTFKANLESSGDANKAILQTIETGMEYGDGSIVGSTEDYSNAYDNFMILRGALWAAANHTVTKKVSKSWLGERTTITVQYTPKDQKPLTTSISKSDLQAHGVWLKRK